jgi:hypothetical protein
VNERIDRRMDGPRRFCARDHYPISIAQTDG